MPRIKADTIEEHKVLVRREALRAARDLFRAHGYRGTTLGDVSAAIGVGRTTLYEYFADKEDLLVAVVEDAFPEVIEDLVRGLPDRLPPSQRLTELAVRMMEFVATDSNLGTILMREVPKLSEEAQARVMRAHGVLVDELVRVYEEGLEMGEFREIPSGLAQRYIHELIMASAAGLLASEDPKQRLHEVADALSDFLLHGMGTRGMGTR